MTSLEAINAINKRKPNTFEESEIVGWLSELDSKIKLKIIDTHEGAEKVSFTPYGEETPSDTVLLVPEPFSCVYLSWLESRMDYANGEYDKYNNSAMQYNSDYMEFENYYHRMHVPYGTSLKFF